MATVGKLASIEDALFYRLSQLTLTPSLPIAYPNTPYVPVVGSTFLEALNLPNRTDYAGVGLGAARRHRGLLQVIINSPQNAGATAASEVADKIIEWFIAADVIPRNGVRVRIGSFDGSAGVPYRTTAYQQDGWQKLPVTIPWWCDV